MAQHIGCQIVDEFGKVIKDSNLNFAPIYFMLWKIDKKQKQYLWLHTIDPYGDTVFNTLQIPIIISELEDLLNEVDQKEQDLIRLVDEFLDFIKSAISVHTYIKFIGD
jgi:hypothetical protein